MDRESESNREEVLAVEASLLLKCIESGDDDACRA
ncbi:MAG: hypothetical protein K0R19_2808 [Bacillota bacterium]|jgi:hypothetical protein|nr:hypothetical protein [Bacillota bacterium]